MMDMQAASGDHKLSNKLKFLQLSDELKLWLKQSQRKLFQDSNEDPAMLSYSNEERISQRSILSYQMSRSQLWIYPDRKDLPC